MRVLHKMPSLETDAQRSAFYRWWGTDTTVINATAKHCSYAPYSQRLSIKCAFGGAEHYGANNQCFRVEDGRYLLLEDGCVTESFIGSDLPVNSFSIFFAPDALQRFCGAAGESVDRRVSLHGGLRRMDGEVGPILREIWSKTRPTSSHADDVEALLDELLVLIATRELQPDSPAHRTRQTARRKLNRARDYIESHYHEPLTLEDVAAAAALSPFHLSRAFKQAFGLSPMSYVKRRRVEAAARLIQVHGLRVGEAAARVGFVSRATFVRQYRRRFGVLPSGRR